MTESRERERKQEREGGRLDGYGRNNETKQDRMRAEERDERRETAQCCFMLRYRNLRRSSRRVVKRRGGGWDDRGEADDG